MTACSPDIFGSDPVNIQWQIVRGDTSTIRVDFLQQDEVTYFDTTGWDVAATAYDFRADSLDELEVSLGDGFVEIVAPSEITELWGDGFRSVVAELAFDIQVTLPDDVVWTPVVGTIRVLGDVTGSL